MMYVLMVWPTGRVRKKWVTDSAAEGMDRE